MSRRILTLAVMNCLIVLGVTLSVSAQQPGGEAKGGKGGFKAKAVTPRPGLFFREIWVQTPANDEHPLSQQAVWNPDLELKIYGEGAVAHDAEAGIQLTGTRAETNPIHTWTGVCEKPCAYALRHRTKMADLSGLGRIRANTKTSGMHQVRPMVKLADGTWWVAEEGAGTFTDWISHEWALADQRWLQLDIDRVVTRGQWTNEIDLSRVDEIGFADLMPGSGHGAGGWSDVAEIEVFANSVDR